MNFLKAIKDFFTKKSPPQEEKGVLSSTEISLSPPSSVGDKKILKDKNGDNLICSLCNNLDNETNKENPIYEGQKKTYDGKIWHIRCFRYFQKHAGEFMK